MKVQLHNGDRGLEKFMSSWDGVLTGIKEEPSLAQKQELFMMQVRKCDALKIDIAAYDRALEGSKEKSYAFLHDSARS